MSKIIEKTQTPFEDLDKEIGDITSQLKSFTKQNWNLAIFVFSFKSFLKSKLSAGIVLMGALISFGLTTIYAVTSRGSLDNFTSSYFPLLIAVLLTFYSFAFSFVFVAGRVVQTFTKEIEIGIMLVILSKPVTKRNIFFQKYFGLLASIIVFALVLMVTSYLSIWLGIILGALLSSSSGGSTILSQVNVVTQILSREWNIVQAVSALVFLSALFLIFFMIVLSGVSIFISLYFNTIVSTLIIVGAGLIGFFSGSLLPAIINITTLTATTNTTLAELFPPTLVGGTRYEGFVYNGDSSNATLEQIEAEGSESNLNNIVEAIPGTVLTTRSRGPFVDMLRQSLTPNAQYSNDYYYTGLLNVNPLAGGSSGFDTLPAGFNTLIPDIDTLNLSAFPFLTPNQNLFIGTSSILGTTKQLSSSSNPFLIRALPIFVESFVESYNRTSGANYFASLFNVAYHVNSMLGETILTNTPLIVNSFINSEQSITNQNFGFNLDFRLYISTFSYLGDMNVFSYETSPGTGELRPTQSEDGVLQYGEYTDIQFPVYVANEPQELYPVGSIFGAYGIVGIGSLVTSYWVFKRKALT